MVVSQKVDEFMKELPWFFLLHKVEKWLLVNEAIWLSTKKHRSRFRWTEYKCAAMVFPLIQFWMYIKEEPKLNKDHEIS